jgi:branched-chain amino acid transport system substrate-binding protein
VQKNVRRLAALCGALTALALVTTACSSSSKSSGSGSSPTATVASSAPSQIGTLPAKISLTSIQDLTGVASAQGQHAKAGYDAAVKEINDTNFLGTSKLDITYQDTTGVATTAASLMNQAVVGKDAIVFGPISGTESLAAAPIATQAKVPMIVTQASSPGLTTPTNNVFRATPLQQTYTTVSAAFIQKQGFKNVALLTVTDVATIVAIADVFTQSASKYGYTIVDKEETTSKATDLSTQLTKIVDKKPDAVIVLAYSSQNPTAVSQLRSAGFTGPIIGQQGMGGGVLTPLGNNANKIYWATDFNAAQTNAGAKQFVTQWAKYGSGGTPDNFNAEGYDAVWLAARALKDAGSIDRATVLTSLGKVASAGFQGALGDIKFVDHDEVASGVLVQWINGQETLVTS